MQLKDIFASKTQVKLLVFFTDNPRKEYYQTELCKKLNESLGSIQYEVNRLVRMNFLNRRKSKIRTYYSMDPDFALLEEVRAIIKKVKK
jgi:DNA-binding MarR family transcriptional regulator